MVDHFEKNYAVKDKQDVLAMCALQIAVQSSKEADANTTSQSDVHKKIVLLSKYLTEQLAS
jgi:cell division protein ZapA